MAPQFSVQKECCSRKFSPPSQCLAAVMKTKSTGCFLCRLLPESTSCCPQHLVVFLSQYIQLMLGSPRHTMYMKRFLKIKFFLLFPDTLTRGNKKTNHHNNKKKPQKKDSKKTRYELLGRGTQPPLSSTGYVTVHRFTSLLYFVKEVKGHTITVLVQSQSQLNPAEP